MQSRWHAKLLIVLLLCAAASPAMAAGSKLSSNWAGYVATRAHEYSAVGASWVVPKLAATTTLMSDAAWVGIGGSTSRDLIQAGTHSVVENGRTQYWAWYELLPDYQTRIPLAVTGGDTITVSITELSGDLWYISFVNDTTGAQYGHALEYDSKLSSADWIEEMPKIYTTDGIQAYAPLSEFGKVTFSDAYAVAGGERKSIDSLRADAVTMVSKLNKRLTLAAPGGIEDGGFTITRSSAVPSPAGKRAHADFSNILWSNK